MSKDSESDVLGYKNFLGADEILSVDELEACRANVSLYERKIAGGFRPNSKKNVEAIVRWANSNKVALFPFSKGNNWAFGSRLPSSDNNYLLDLSRLNEISDYRADLGSVRIGPGVTQAQLADFLQAADSRFFLDVTGSGRQTSIIGNALERGIAYNSLRVDHILNLEVLLGNGDRVRTGFGARTAAPICDLYPYGVGPHIDQLFFQSNFGIILSATYQLHSKPPVRDALQIQFSEKNLKPVLEKLKILLQNGTLDCIVHLADPYRSASTLVPLLGESDRAQSYKNTMSGNWSGIASVYGSKQVVRAKLKEIKSEMRTVSSIRVFNEKKIAFIENLARAIGLKKFAEFLKSTQGLRGLVQGKPTDDALRMASFNPNAIKAPIAAMSQVDGAERGLLFCVPVAPFDSNSGAEMVRVTREFEAQYKEINFGITLNTLNEKVLEAVISLHFNKMHRDLAHSVLLKLYAELAGKGFPPYRLNSQIMDVLPVQDSHYSELLTRIKKACDPNGVLAPGRYS